MMTALICEKRGASASERTCPAAVQFTQLHNAQQTRTKDAPPGDTRNLRYRRIREVPVPGLDRCVCVCVFIPAREICYFKSAEQKTVQEPQLQNKLTPKTPDQLLIGSSARVLHETAGKCF